MSVDSGGGGGVEFYSQRSQRSSLLPQKLTFFCYVLSCYVLSCPVLSCYVRPPRSSRVPTDFLVCVSRQPAPSTTRHVRPRPLFFFSRGRRSARQRHQRRRNGSASKTPRITTSNSSEHRTSTSNCEPILPPSHKDLHVHLGRLQRANTWQWR